MRGANYDDDAPLKAAMKSCVMMLAYLTVSSITIAAQETCYWPNGDPAKDINSVAYSSCHEGNSTCCAVNEACISNGLCYGSTIDLMYRGACTSPDWTGCPSQFCNDIQYDTWANIWNCPPNENGSYWWCGLDAAKACQTGDDAYVHTFGINGGMLTTIIASQQLAVSTSLTTTSTSGATASTVGSPPTTTTTAVVNGGNSQSSKTSVAIGAGVGIPLGVAALGFLGFLIWREKNLRMRHRGDKVVPKPTLQEYSPATAIQQSSPRELTGHVVGSELVAPAPVHEMSARS